MSAILLKEEKFLTSIYTFRQQKVMLDFDLADIYGVDTKTLKRAVRRNLIRFPEDFMFELTEEEFANLRYQIGASSWGGSRYPPFAFTEHGAVMLASVLNSETAVQASLYVVRSFIKLRQLANTYELLAVKIGELEEKYDGQIEYLLNSLEALTEYKNEPRNLIGFKKA